MPPSITGETPAATFLRPALISTVGLALVLSSSSACAQQNLIVNGSFESGAQAGVEHFPGWDLIGPASNNSNYGTAQSGEAPDVAQQGSFYAYFHGHPTDSSQDCLGQTLNLIAGQQYTISYYLATGGPTLGVSVTVAAPPAPRLDLSLSRTHTLVFTWTFPTNGYRLQANTSLGTTNWVALTNAPLTLGSTNQIVLPAPPRSLFYRLSY